MKKKILIGDDDPSVRQMIGRVLEVAGYMTLRSGGGSEAVSKFRAAEPDLVLLDLRSPDHHGWEAFEQISRFNSLVPLIAITAWPNQYGNAVERGIDALMEKPLDLQLLLQTIGELLAEPESVRTQRITDRNFTTAYLGHPNPVASHA